MKFRNPQLDLTKGVRLSLIINTLSTDKLIERVAAQIRRASVEAGVPCLTSLDTAHALILSTTAKARRRALRPRNGGRVLEPHRRLIRPRTLPRP